MRVSPKLTNASSVRNQSSFLPLVHFTEEKGWISVTSVVIRDDYPGYENILSCFFFRLYVNIKVNFDFVPVEVQVDISADFLTAYLPSPLGRSSLAQISLSGFQVNFFEAYQSRCGQGLKTEMIFQSIRVLKN